MTIRYAAFGEVLLRYSPPSKQQLLQTPNLDVWIGGAEANVLSALASLGHDVRLISAVPDNALGQAAVRSLKGLGVDTRYVIQSPGRMGIYYVTTGAGHRPTEVLYDRAGSSFADAGATTWDWSAALADRDHLHLSGITPALGATGTQNALAAARAATDAGLRISFDGNYRESLWRTWDGRPRETLRSLVEHATILFGNHRDISLLLDAVFPDSPERPLNAAQAAFAAFPRLQLIASTCRQSISVDEHRISTRLDSRNDHFETEPVVIGGIVDRIGAGDAFAAGVLHGLGGGLTALREAALDGLAATVLKHSLPGDACLVDRAALAAYRDGGWDVRR